MKKKSHFLDGQLYRWLRHWNVIKLFSDSPLLTHDEELRFARNDIADMVKLARKQGASWLYTEDSIEERGKNDFTLPSVDIMDLLDLTSNNAIKETFIDYGFGKLARQIEWDTESSAWYPKFESRKLALETIAALNVIFDAKYNFK